MTDIDELFERLNLGGDRADHLADRASPGARQFPLRVPLDYVQRIRPGDPDDPLLRQILPLAAEHDQTASAKTTTDAVGDRASSLGDGVLHKYRGRALLVTTGACAIHCRYCFRQHFDYQDDHAGGSHTRAAIERIANDSSIREVILSGGDPLSLANHRLRQLTDALTAIPHVETLRIHSRTPIVAPARIDSGLIGQLQRLPIPCVIVVHANHPNELSASVQRGLKRLAGTGATLFNQSVLLKGVNDNADTLRRLSKMLFQARTLPYYLHMKDAVVGTEHFNVDEQSARRIVSEMAAYLPGYLVPKLARERAGEAAKEVIGIHAA